MLKTAGVYVHPKTREGFPWPHICGAEGMGMFQGWKGGAQLGRAYTNSCSRKTPKRKFWRGFSVIKKYEDFDYRSFF